MILPSAFAHNYIFQLPVRYWGPKSRNENWTSWTEGKATYLPTATSGRMQFVLGNCHH